MRTKLTALIVTCAGPRGRRRSRRRRRFRSRVYTFQTQDDVNAFQKVAGHECKRKWVGQSGAGDRRRAQHELLHLPLLGGGGLERTSTPIRGWSAPRPSAGGARSCRRSRSWASGCAGAADAGYVLRILPNAHKWQYFRDPKGAAGPEARGVRHAASFIKVGREAQHDRDPRLLLRRDSTSVIASVNGRGVVSATDAGADQPDGRQTVVSAGAKGSGAGTGITGVFDNVIVQVPNPF